MSNIEDGKAQTKQFANMQERAQYKFTAEEAKVIKECNYESFYQRCLPFGGLLGLSTYYGVKSGYFAASPRFGASPKVAVAVILGYFMGKFSYQSKCAEKLMQLPNSQIGEMLRQRRRGQLKESGDSGFGSGMSLTPFGDVRTNDVYSDFNPRNSLDIDTSRPEMSGLDDSFRPSVDNPVYDEELPPVQQHNITTSYDELRKKNREEYQSKRIGSYKEPARPAPVSPPVDREPYQNKPTNKYGDSFE